MADAPDTSGRRVLIAIDGPAAAGKTTVARSVAARLGIDYLDTGSMYRALALTALQGSIDCSDEGLLLGVLDRAVIQAEGNRILVDGEDVSGSIRGAEVAEAASRAASHPLVRRRMVAVQKAMALGARRGAVLEGRDVGTVVLPDADIKVFITAGDQERARRRSLESGAALSEELDAIRSRDRRDTQRTASPLVAAPDAIVIDTTGMSADEVADRIVSMAKAAAAE